jgi:hypothetical protein
MAGYKYRMVDKSTDVFYKKVGEIDVYISAEDGKFMAHLSGESEYATVSTNFSTLSQKIGGHTPSTRVTLDPPVHVISVSRHYSGKQITLLPYQIDGIERTGGRVKVKLTQRQQPGSSYRPYSNWYEMHQLGGEWYEANESVMKEIDSITAWQARKTEEIQTAVKLKNEGIVAGLRQLDQSKLAEQYLK